MADKLTWYVCTYRFAGRVFSLHIEARDRDEVSARLRAIGVNGHVNGELIVEGNVFPSFRLLRLRRYISLALFGRGNA